MSEDIAVDIFDGMVKVIDSGGFTKDIEGSDEYKNRYDKLLSRMAHGLQDAQIDNLPEELTASTSFTKWIQFMSKHGLLRDDDWDTKYFICDGWLNSYKNTVKLWNDSPEAYEIMLEFRDGIKRENIPQEILKKITNYLRELSTWNENKCNIDITENEFNGGQRSNV